MVRYVKHKVFIGDLFSVACSDQHMSVNADGVARHRQTTPDIIQNIPLPLFPIGREPSTLLDRIGGDLHPGVHPWGAVRGCTKYGY